MIHNTILLLVKIGVLAWTLVYTTIKVLSDFLILVQPFFPNIPEELNRKNISLLCYWDGKISRGTQGITYEDALPKAIKVSCEIKYSDLIEKIYALIGIDSEKYKLKIICRYLANGQYIALPIDDDESVDIMLDMTKEKGINCVEIYIEKLYVSIRSQSVVRSTVNNGECEVDQKPMTTRDPSEYVHLTVRMQTGKERVYRIKRGTPLRELITAYCEREAYNTDYKYIFRGRIIHEDSTPNTYGMEDGAVIHVVMSLRGD